ncbi:hypothetical protein ACKKBG_A22845 [Auxenochlorella protothecoides x Auxenochlorella symbiontica]
MATCATLVPPRKRQAADDIDCTEASIASKRMRDRKPSPPSRRPVGTVLTCCPPDSPSAPLTPHTHTARSGSALYSRIRRWLTEWRKQLLGYYPHISIDDCVLEGVLKIISALTLAVPDLSTILARDTHSLTLYCAAATWLACKVDSLRPYTPCCSLMAALCRVPASKLRTAELEICYRLDWSFARILSTTGTIGDPITDDFPALFAGG